ncbi:membrane dipeptidase [Microbacterium sp. Se63.02b]|uniref:membrane dipeptidase n=1 Tax=Microbacterium sp. Se63.02b TaxID=2709304 RepID=UPI001FCE31DE|nr:membrane dipeptidase [Microbacterium sp. Se63.02b]
MRSPRNVPDDVLAAIGAQGGVVMVPFVPTFLSQARRDWWEAGGEGDAPRVGVRDVADHLDHIRRVAGAHAVGIGADYDGSDAMPEGLADVSGYPTLFAELRTRGWSEADLAGLANENVLRVLAASDQDHEAFLAGTAGEPAPAALTPAVDTTAREGAL